MDKDSYKNEVITKSMVPDDLLSGMTIGTLQEDFPLTEGDFLRLKSSQSSTTTWAINFLFATIGYGISIAPKWIGELTGKTDTVSQAEWLTLFIGFVVSIILYGIGCLVPNDRKITMNKIELHFNSAPKSRHFIRDPK